MILWKTSLTPYVELLSSPSAAFLPLLLKLPDKIPSVHIALYLPTSGKDPEFVTALSLLDLFLEDILGCHSHWPLYLRGDAMLIVIQIIQKDFPYLNCFWISMI